VNHPAFGLAGHAGVHPHAELDLARGGSVAAGGVDRSRFVVGPAFQGAFEFFVAHGMLLAWFFWSKGGGMRWAYYSLAFAATVAACFFWWVVAVELRSGFSPARAASSSGVLPVVLPVRPADPVRAALFEQLQRGQAVCLGGFYAVKANDGTPYLVETSAGRVPCP